MNMKHLILATGLIAVSSLAWADMRPDSSTLEPKTRAQIQQELRQARAQGLTNVREDEYPIIQQTEAHKTRAQVGAELRQAQAQGLTRQSDDKYPIIPKMQGVRTRAEVRQEAIQEARIRYGRDNTQSLYFGG